MIADQILSALFNGETVNTLKDKLGLSVAEINGAMRGTDLVVCPHCLTVSNIGALVGESTNDCPVCSYSILTQAI